MAEVYTKQSLKLIPPLIDQALWLAVSSQVTGIPACDWLAMIGHCVYPAYDSEEVNYVQLHN